MTVSDGTTASGIDAVLVRGGMITGSVQSPDGPVSSGLVCADRIGSSGSIPEPPSLPRYCSGVSSNENQIYFIAGLAPGHYRVSFTGSVLDQSYSEYYDNATDPAQSTPVTVTAGVTTFGIDAEFGTEPPPPQPTLTIEDTTVPEGNSGAKDGVFSVRLSATSTQTVTVSYATSDGSAIAGSDYMTRTGQLTFAPGTTTLTVAVPVLGDRVDEPDESFSLTLSQAANATMPDSAAVATIIDDDPQERVIFLPLITR